MSGRGFVFPLIAVAVVVLDQATKAMVRAALAPGERWPEGWAVSFSHVTNSGAAFGLLRGQTTLLIVMTAFGLGAILLYYVMPPVRHRLLAPALGLVLGGATGNFIDRVRLGKVTDFVHFPHYPDFNVADSAITVGVVVLAGAMLLAEARPAPEEPEGPEPER